VESDPEPDYVGENQDPDEQEEEEEPREAEEQLPMEVHLQPNSMPGLDPTVAFGVTKQEVLKDSLYVVKRPRMYLKITGICSNAVKAAFKLAGFRYSLRSLVLYRDFKAVLSVSRPCALPFPYASSVSSAYGLWYLPACFQTS
jgi:hypothetical protein